MSATNAPIDSNSRQGLIAASSLGDGTIVRLVADPVTGRLLTDASGSSTPPGGLNTQLQYNNAGAFGGITGATTDGTIVSLSGAHLLNPTINGAGTGLATLAYPNTSTSATITVPATTGTVALTSQLTSGTVTSVSVVSANGFAGTVATATTTPAITLTTSVTGVLQGNGTAISAATTTGSGNVVLATSPTLVTPALGTPSSGVLTNTTGLPAVSVVAGTFGSGAYTMDTRLTVPQILNADNAVAAVSNAATVTRANRNNVVTNNSAAGITITLSTTSAAAGDMILVQSLPSSAVAQAITWANTEISDVIPSANLNASTTSPRTDGFKWNPLTSKWRCIASA